MITNSQRMLYGKNYKDTYLRILFVRLIIVSEREMKIMCFFLIYVERWYVKLSHNTSNYSVELRIISQTKYTSILCPFNKSRTRIKKENNLKNEHTSPFSTIYLFSVKKNSELKTASFLRITFPKFISILTYY